MGKFGSGGVVVGGWCGGGFGLCGGVLGVDVVVLVGGRGAFKWGWGSRGVMGCHSGGGFMGGSLGFFGQGGLGWLVCSGFILLGGFFW